MLDMYFMTLLAPVRRVYAPRRASVFWCDIGSPRSSIFFALFPTKEPDPRLPSESQADNADARNIREHLSRFPLTI